MSDEEFDEEVEAAAEGRWSELGLDPPGQTSTESVEEFLKDAPPDA